ncbi:hypothetical protein Tco_1132849 [Tanacetum coccineum]|uniref:Uncharacterized protein n=1 Tax=Tanacetum coccineum TaxID=301880 RepID=A0ABQ5JG05_9ASTR
MEEYMTIIGKDYDSGINEKGRIELKGRSLLKLSNNALSGTNGEDAVEHIEKFLKDYWRRGDDEERVTDDEFTDPEDGSLIEENEIAEIFRIETDIFQFKTPLCKAFDEFNYPFQIDVDVLTNDILGFKTYDEYKNAWMYGWDKDIPWVANRPWVDYGPYFEWYDPLKDSDLKKPLINKAILEKSINEEEESSDDAWSHYSPIDEWNDYEHTTYIKTDDDDDDIDELEDYSIQKDPPYYVQLKKKNIQGRRCKLLGIPYMNPPTYKSEKFKVVKYSDAVVVKTSHEVLQSLRQST